MKKTIIIMLMSIVTLLTAPSCISQGKVFKEVASMPDVTSVYIGPAMLRLAGGAASTGGYGEYSKYITGLKSLEVISCEKSSSVKKVSEACDRMLAEMHYEVLLETNEDDEHTVIYGGMPEGDNPDILDDIVIVNKSAKEYNLVYIRGKINVGEMVKEQAGGNATDSDAD